MHGCIDAEKKGRAKDGISLCRNSEVVETKLKGAWDKIYISN